MSTTQKANDTIEPTPCKYVISESPVANKRCSYSTRESGRAIFREPGGEMLNVARLTAYVEHGEDIFEKVTHHEIPGYKVDIPEYLQPMSRSEHTAFHCRNPKPVMVDGIPLLRPEGESDQ